MGFFEGIYNRKILEKCKCEEKCMKLRDFAWISFGKILGNFKGKVSEFGKVSIKICYKWGNVTG